MNKRNTESLKNKICSEIYGISATSQYKEGKRDGLNKALSIIEGWEKENSVIDVIISESEANGVCTHPKRSI